MRNHFFTIVSHAFKFAIGDVTNLHYMLCRSTLAMGFTVISLLQTQIRNQKYGLRIGVDGKAFRLHLRS